MRLLAWVFWIVTLVTIPAFAEQTIEYDPFGKITIYRPTLNPPACTIIFISGPEGWTGKAAEMARRISTEQQCLVAGIDLPSYQKQLGSLPMFCPSGDIARLALYFQKTQGSDKYLTPILVGYGEGGVIVYAALAQMPYALLGGVVYDFCPDFPEVEKSCFERAFRGIKLDNGRISFIPFKKMEIPFFVFSAGDPPGCSVHDIAGYLSDVPNSKFASPGKDWMDSFKDALAQLTKRQQAPPALAAVRDLPLIEMPATAHDTLFIVLSGDGGWVDLARDLAEDLSSRGYAVVGFDTLQYFWSRQKPEQAAQDLNRAITSYLAAWKKKKAVVIGYSLGADVLPFMVRALPNATRQMLGGVALIGPSVRTEFEFNVSELDRHPGPSPGEPVMPAIKAMGTVPVLCLAGFNERESVCKKIDQAKADMPNVSVEMVPGGHMFGREEGALPDMLLQHFGIEAKTQTQPQTSQSK